MGIDPASLAVTMALNAASMAITASQVIEGPRLDSLGVTTSDYGQPIPYAYGTRRLFGVPCIWAEPLTEVKEQNKTKGGKYNEYKYFGTWAVMMTDHEISAVSRIWFDKHLVYDATGSGPLSPITGDGHSILEFMRIYTGTSTQDPDPRIQATVDAAMGAGMTPAYRGRAYIVFEDLPLEKLGNRLPQVDVEVVAVPTDAFPREIRDKTVDSASIAFSPDRSRFVLAADHGAYEIWDVASRSKMITGVLGGDFVSSGVWQQPIFAVTQNGKIYGLTYSEDAFEYFLTKFPADGVGPPFAEVVTGQMLGPAYVLYLDSAYGEFLGMPIGPTLSGGWLFDVKKEEVVFVSPTTWLGVNARIKHFFVDMDGDIWAVCGNIGLATNEVGFIRLTGIAAGYIVTLPSTVGSSNAPTYAMHYRDADVDHFVVARALTSGGNDWALVDTTTMTVTDSAALGLSSVNPYPFSFVRPGARYLYEGERRIDMKDLSVIGWDLDDWGGAGEATLTAKPEVYDEVNHAILRRYSSGEIAWFYLDRIAGNAVTLRSIVEDVAERCGLTVANDIDATTLDQMVEGYSWVQGRGSEIAQPLLEFFNSEVRPHDFKLQFVKRGASSNEVIRASEMVPEGGKRYNVNRTLDTDLPRSINVNFADPDMDQQPNSARSQRYADATDGRREQSLDVTTLVVDIDDARSAADGYLRRAWFSAEAYDLSLTRAHTKLEPGDVRILVLDDVTRVAKLTELEFGANGVLNCNFLRDGSTPHLSGDSPAASPSTQHVAQVQPGAPADGYVPPVILTPAYSRGIVLDIPLVQDSHDDLILYMAAGPYSTDVTWGGALIYESVDEGETYTQVESVNTSQKAVWGYTTEALPDALSTVWDRASSLNVVIHSGTLTSCTEAEAENGANMAVLGQEIIHFTTATLEGDGSYTLSGFLRGRRGTEQHTDAHVSGDTFVLVTPMVRHDMGVSDLTQDFVYKTVSAGAINQAGFTTDVEFSGASLKPYSPAHLKVVNSSGDYVVTWVRRTRLGGFNVYSTTPPLGESTEEYVGQILDGGGNIIRTFSGLTSPTFTYTAAQQASDGSPIGITARVMQVSSTVGNGFPADVALAA